MRRIIILIMLLAGAGEGVFAGQTVTDSTATGFTVKHEIILNCSPDSAWKCFLRVDKWWDPEHTWSMDSKNLFIEPRAGGVFGEKLSGGGSALHMTVYYVSPGVTIILRGAIGPLMSQGVDGSMAFTFAPDGTGTKILFQYMVGGYTPGGLWRFAPIVDMVLGHQLDRLKAYSEGK